jgi:hypothetical protein
MSKQNQIMKTKTKTVKLNTNTYRVEFPQGGFQGDRRQCGHFVRLVKAIGFNAASAAPLAFRDR